MSPLRSLQATSSCPGAGGPVFRPWPGGCMPQPTCGLAVMIGRCWPLLVALGGPRGGPVALPRTLIARRSSRASGRPRLILTLTREVTTGRTRRCSGRNALALANQAALAAVGGAVANTLSNCPRLRSVAFAGVRAAAQRGCAYSIERQQPSAHRTKTKATRSLHGVRSRAPAAPSLRRAAPRSVRAAPPPAPIVMKCAALGTRFGDDAA